jgi:hypothetical protein
MIGYGLLLGGETLLALVALGLAGGWALVPFRREDRPYLWLAAPLAGVSTLSVSLTFLFFGCGLSLPTCVEVAWPLLAAATFLSCLRRMALSLSMLPVALLGLVVVGWCVLASNWTAIRQREPTVCMQYGSDMIGYSQYASWLLQHPDEMPPWSPNCPAQAWPNMCYWHDTRPGGYLLTGAAAWLRGTRPIFSYDLLSGVGLAAGILRLGGLFASRRRNLLLLLGAGMVSLWFALSRTGYLGKTLCYPGCLMLAFTLLATWQRLSAVGLLASAVLSAGFLLCHTPLTGFAVLFLLCAGGTLVILADRLARRLAPAAVSASTAGWPHPGRALLICLAMLVPVVLVYLPLFWIQLTDKLREHYTLDWFNLFTIALDLDGHPLFVLGTMWDLSLVGCALLLAGIFIVLAWRQRDFPALCLLLPVTFLPICRLLRVQGIYQFTGLLFPLTVAGSVLVVQGQQGRVGRGWRPQMLFALLAATVALRVPQAMWTAHFLGFVPRHSPALFTQSEVASLVHQIGDRTVDVDVSDIYAGLLLLMEFDNSGIRAQYGEKTWQRTVGYARWPPPRYPARGVLGIDEGQGWAAPEAIRWQGDHYRLRDGASVAFTYVEVPYTLGCWEGRTAFWQGASPTTIEFCNGTGSAVKIRVIADCRMGPASPDLSHRTIRYTFAGSSNTVVLTQAQSWNRLRIPLELPPGRHRLKLAVSSPPATIQVGPVAPGDLLLLIKDLRLERQPTSSGGENVSSPGKSAGDGHEHRS